ncbi:MAG: glutathione S-transferase C-terminal domain-containing protein [Rhodobacteraceae bacterium]|nr:glutathione S-transferase C-terminal domain-containing protein [Paracoccaceae bacterium]
MTKIAGPSTAEEKLAMIQLYSVFTANGQKVHVMLEECELEYSAMAVDLVGGAHRTPEFRSLNPFARVPIIIDEQGPDGNPITVCETIAILEYLSAKTGRFMPSSARGRVEVAQWLSFITSNVGPLFRGIFMFSNIVPGKIQPAIEHFQTEAKKAFAVLDAYLADHEFLAANEYTIADINAYPVAATSSKSIARGLEPYTNIRRWADSIAKRAAVQRGMKVLG